MNGVISAWYKEIGSKGGSANTEAQMEARKANVLKPCAPGKKRGRPVGWRKQTAVNAA